MNPDNAGYMLVVNCGSSSVKYQLIDLATHTWRHKGLIENIGHEATHHLRIRPAGPHSERQETRRWPCPDIDHALHAMTEALRAQSTPVTAVVHRVVHGGDRYREPVRITSSLLAELATLDVLAPLHNPANRRGIELCNRLLPDCVQFAVFDTAFHATLPPHASRYAIPSAWHAIGVKRYGFHGTSHSFVAKQAAQWLGKPLAQTNLVTLHLGNGASVTAIENGLSIDTSMGLTPLEGLIMGSRCGDVDIGMLPFVARELGLTMTDMEHMLWQESGLRALAGTNDMRILLQRADAGDEHAILAIEMFCYRIRKYIGAYVGILEQTDAIVFTGGIGENAHPIRQHILAKLTALGIDIDHVANARGGSPCFCISTTQSRIPVLVIATNEELEMVLQAAALL